MIEFYIAKGPLKGFMIELYMNQAAIYYWFNIIEYERHQKVNL